MFDGWENFYLIIGPSAGALIGLMFVVVTLTAGRDSTSTERGKHLYTSPIVWHLAAVLVLSAGAVVPRLNPHHYGYAALAAALLGLGMATRSTLGIWKHQMTGEDSFFDMWWYGIIPGIAYIVLGAAGIATLLDYGWRAEAVAFALAALLMVSVHAEWDLVTFLAPLAGTPPEKRDKKR